MFKVKIEGLNEMIANFEQCKKEYETEMIFVFFNRAYKYIIEKANQYIDGTQIGEATKAQIKSGWQPCDVKKVGNGYKLVIKNIDDSAVFIEFGVGIEGKKMPHTNAGKTNPEYKYNIGTKIKGNVWLFHQDDAQEVDIARKYYWEKKNSKGEIIEDTYLTRGQPAVMYLYKACQDFVMVAPRYWEETKKMFWR